MQALDGIAERNDVHASLSQYLEPPAKGRLLHEEKRCELVLITDRDAVISENPQTLPGQELCQLKRAEHSHCVQHDAYNGTSEASSGRLGGGGDGYLALHNCLPIEHARPLA